jgi:hypothetical protein
MKPLHQIIIVFLLLLTSVRTFADSAFCSPEFSSLLKEDSQYRTATGPAFFLLHPNVKEFKLGTTLFGIASAYEEFLNIKRTSRKPKQFESFFFYESDEYNHHMFPTCTPTQFVLSESGRSRIAYRGNTVIFTGGFLSANMRSTLAELLKNYEPIEPKKNLSIIYYVPAIYENYKVYSLEPLKESYQNDLVYQSLAPFYEVNLSTTLDLSALFRLMDYVKSRGSAQAFENLFWDRLAMYFTPNKHLFVNNIEQTGLVLNYPANYHVDIDTRMSVDHPPFERVGDRLVFGKKRIVTAKNENSPSITMYIVDALGMASLRNGTEVDWGQ